MIYYILIAYSHKPESGCSGSWMGRFYIRGGSFKAAFDACNRNRRCGCVDTCNGYYYGADWYQIHKGNTTIDNPGSDACHSWAKKNKYFAEG